MKREITLGDILGREEEIKKYRIKTQYKADTPEEEYGFNIRQALEDANKS